MKVLHVVNVADAQSIPLELALAIKGRLDSTIVAGYYAKGDHPAHLGQGDIVSLGAKGPFDIAAIKRLIRLIRKERPDIVHMHHAVSAFWCALISAARSPRPLLVKTEHNDHRFLPRHQLAINAMLYPFLSRIVCNSDTTKKSFTRLERRLAGDRAVRIYNGVDIARVRRALDPGGQRGAATHEAPIWIGNVGRLVPQKNQERLIAGLARARSATGRDIRLEIVGAGPLRAALEQQASDQGVTDAVQFAGALPRDAVYDRLGRWQGFIMSSRFEGFCNALVEAMAAGLPVAVSDIDTLHEVADPSAIRFDHADEEAIGRAIADLAERGPADASFAERYDIDRSVEEHIALYAAMASGRTVPGPKEAVGRVVETRHHE